MRSFAHGIGSLNLQPSLTRRRKTDKKWGPGIETHYFRVENSENAWRGVSRAFVKTGDHIRKAVIALSPAEMVSPGTVRIITTDSSIVDYFKDTSIRLIANKKIGVFTRDKNKAVSLKGFLFKRMPGGLICIVKKKNGVYGEQ